MHGIHASGRAVIACLIAIGLAAPAFAAQVPDQGSIGLPIAAPLAEALRQIAKVLPLDVRLEPGVASVPVSVNLTGLPPYEQLRQVLLASGVDFVVAQRGARFLVIAGNASAARPTNMGETEAEQRQSDEESQIAADAPAPSAPPVEREPEQEAERDAGALVAADEPRVRAAGEVSGDELVALLTATPRAARREAGPVDLPFPDTDGQPIRVWRTGGTPSTLELPFTDEAGVPVLQPVSPAPAGFVELPFPDANGQPIRVPIADTPVPAVSPTPGRVPGRPPGRRD